LRGRDIGMIFQEPMTALNPVQPIGAQVAEVFFKHQNISKSEALNAARKILTRVGLPPEKYPLTRYPFELSGGQRQRVVIAMATALKPKLLIADEPTTALDVTTQAQILSLLKELCTEDNMSLIYISHDLASVTHMSDYIAIMKDGEIIEKGPTHSLFEDMSHSYSLGLRDVSLRRKGESHAELISGGTPILSVENLICDYKLPRRHFFAKPTFFRAIDGVSFEIQKRESLGLVGQSGSGKSTLARTLLGLHSPAAGSFLVNSVNFLSASKKERRKLRALMQVVFQDPYGSFNPRHKVDKIIAEPLHLLDSSLTMTQKQDRVKVLLEKVGLEKSDADKYPHQFSGGQRQRIAIARALIINPSLIILDEATSALDVSIRAQITDLLSELSTEYELSYLFISHDLDLVREVTDRVLIMKSGKIVEQGVTKDIFDAPTHPYTKSLVAAKPSLQEEIRKKSVRME